MNDKKTFINFKLNKPEHIFNLRENFTIYLLGGNCPNVDENLYSNSATPEELDNKIKTKYIRVEIMK